MYKTELEEECWSEQYPVGSTAALQEVVVIQAECAVETDSQHLDNRGDQHETIRWRQNGRRGRNPSRAKRNGNVMPTVGMKLNTHRKCHFHGIIITT